MLLDPFAEQLRVRSAFFIEFGDGQRLRLKVVGQKLVEFWGTRTISGVSQRF